MSPHGNPAASKAAPALDLDAAVVPWLLGSILVLAPLLRPSQSAPALLVLELLAVFLLAVILWRPRKDFITRPEAVALTLLVAVPLLYLIPLPTGLVAQLPGREPYLAGQALLAGEEASGFARLSLYPLETESAVLLLLLPLAVFMATRALAVSHALRLVSLLLVLAALQALLGLLQYGAGEGSPLLLGMQLPEVQSAKGTYTNRNHFVGLLEMLLPVALALTLYSVGRGYASAGRGWKRRMAFFASIRGHIAFGYGAIALLLLVGIIFARSRTGIALSILALLLSMPVFARRIGGNNVYGSVGTIIALAVGIGIAIGLVPVLDRFSVAGAIHDDRWTIFSATLDGIGAFLPIGSGPGSYPDVFPAFQPLELGRWFINHAHNDYLEWLFEGGLLSAALILLLLALYARQWLRVWTRDRWSRFRFVQVAAGIGILLLLLHGLSDFNLHNPANIAYFAFLAGVFFSTARDQVESIRPQRGRAPRPKETRSASPTPAKGGPATPVRNDRPEQRRTSRPKETRSASSASAEELPATPVRNDRPEQRRTSRPKDTRSASSASAEELPATPVRNDRPEQRRTSRPKDTRSASPTPAKGGPATPARNNRPEQRRTSRLKEIRSAFSVPARKRPSAPAPNQAESIQPEQGHTSRLKETPSTFSAPAEELPTAPVRNDEPAIDTNLDDRDDRKQAQTTDEPAGNHGLSTDLKCIRKIIGELAHRMPRLLLVQVREAPDKEALASEIRTLGRRLTAYIQAIEQQLEQISNDQDTPRQDLARSPADPGSAKEERPGGDVSHRGDLEALQTDLESVLAAIDAFVDHPDRDNSLSDFSAKLRDAEQRCPVIADEPAEAPQGKRSRRQDAAEHEPTTAGEPDTA